MSLRSCLGKPVRWLRAGYPRRNPHHGYMPLLALMPSKTANLENLAPTGEPAALRVPRPRTAGVPPAAAPPGDHAASTRRRHLRAVG